jgi:hypothetical protein
MAMLVITRGYILSFRLSSEWFLEGPRFFFSLWSRFLSEMWKAVPGARGGKISHHISHKKLRLSLVSLSYHYDYVLIILDHFSLDGISTGVPCYQHGSFDWGEDQDLEFQRPISRALDPIKCSSFVTLLWKDKLWHGAVCINTNICEYWTFLVVMA